MASAAAVMRKTVSVLFCDVAGSTELGEQLDPEALRAVMSRWFEEMRAPVERTGGTVEKFIGDAVMAVFGIPAVHEDDAFRAVQAAVEMRSAATALGVSVRIGVNTGEVVTGDGSTTLVTGDAVNTAKRLEEAASAGEILIGAATERLVANATKLEPAGAIAARGKRAPVDAWRVLATIPGATPVARRLDAPLVGRTRELAMLDTELEAAVRERTCRLVTVTGAAGVGKSRLAHELATRVGGRARVLTARCLPYGDGITFLPLHELLTGIGAALPDEAASAEEVFHVVRRALEEAAREAPLVVCIEDVHWAQPTFLDLVEYLVGWSSDAAILILCLARPELYDERPRWPGPAVRLDALTEAESAELLDELAAEWPLEPDARARIGEISEGNPLFLEQLVAMVADAGTGAMPPSIQALLAARLDRLEPDEQVALQRAAVAGRDFSLAAVTDLSAEHERSAVAATLFGLVRKEFIRPAPSAFRGEDGFRFRHALIRDAAYAAIPKATRAELHERFADWLEQRGAQDELVGYHLEQAARCRAELGVPDEAVAERAGELLAGAGRRAAARDDMPAARTLLERAVGLAGLGAARPEALRELATARWATGDVDGAAATVEEAITTAVELGDARQEWYARLERAARRRQLHLGDDDLGVVATEAIRVLGALGDHVGLARAWRRLALLCYSSYRFAEAAQDAERAIDHARQAGDEAEAARTVDVYCSSLLYGPEPAASATQRCTELLSAAPGRIAEAAVASALAGLTAMQGSFPEARAHAARAAAIYEDLGLRLLRAGLSEVIAGVETLAGDVRAAERELRASRAIFVEAGAAPLAALHAAFLAQVVLDQGRIEEAEALLSAGQGVIDETDLGGFVSVRLASARLAAGRGRSDVGLRLAEEAVQALRPTDAIVLLAEALAVRSSIAREEPVEALELYALKGNIAAAARARLLVSERAPR